MELVVVLLLVIIAVGVWSMAKSSRASAMAQMARAAVAADAAAVQRAVPDASPVPVIAAPDPATMAVARDAAAAAVSAAERAAEQAIATVRYARERLAGGAKRGIYRDEFTKDASRDLAAEADAIAREASQAARSAGVARASGSTHPRVIGEIALHAHRAALLAQEANSTAFSAFETSDAVHSALAERDHDVSMTAWQVALDARSAARALGGFAQTAEAPGPLGAVIAAVVEAYNAAARWSESCRVTGQAENAAHAAIGSLERAMTQQDTEAQASAARAAIEECKRRKSEELRAGHAAGLASDAAGTAWETVFDMLEAAQDAARRAGRDVETDAAVAQLKAWGEAASEARQVAENCVEPTVDNEGQPLERAWQRVNWLETKYERAISVAKARSGLGEHTGGTGQQ